MKMIFTIAVGMIAGTMAANALGLDLSDLKRLSGTIQLASWNDNRALAKQRTIIQQEFARKRDELGAFAARIKTFEERRMCNADYAKLREMAELENASLFPNPCNN